MLHRRTLYLCLAILSLIAVACGDDDASAPESEFCTTLAEGALGGDTSGMDDAEVAEVQEAIDRLAESTPSELEDQVGRFIEGTQLLLDATVAADGDLVAAFQQISEEQPEVFESLIDAQLDIDEYCDR